MTTSPSKGHVTSLDRQLEVWLPVVGYEGIYEVSCSGRVRSPDRVVTKKTGAQVFFRRCVLLTCPDKRGYLTVGLHRDGRGKTMRVHRLVAEAFIGPRPVDQQCCHNNGDKTFNHVSNLRYDTPLGNSNDKRRHGTMAEGERQGLAKLTEHDVFRIRTCGISPEALAGEYGVAKSTITRAFAGKTWGHLGRRNPLKQEIKL